jgi:AAA+ superfamily predicted ATPase
MPLLSTLINQSNPNNSYMKTKANSKSNSVNANSLSNKIISYVRAGYPGLYLVSHEEQRVSAELVRIAAQLQYSLFIWSAVDGLVDPNKGLVKSALDPLEALMAVEELKEKSIILLQDFHLFLTDPNPILVRQFKDVLQTAKTKNKTLIVLGCRICLPPELERELTIIEFALPDKQQLDIVLSGIIESAKETTDLKPLSPDQRDKVLDSAAGLTTIEAENAFALSVVKVNQIDPAVVAHEKAQAVKKNGLLEIIETNCSLNQIGGLDLLKNWLLKRRSAFTKQALDYGLPSPKGVLILGISGTGKSLTAKATATVFQSPLLKLDAGKIFAGLVGQSEANLRQVIQTAEAIAPCVLWIDELEKGFSGSKSSGATDGGTSARVFGSFLSWLQEKTSPVFVVATANDVSQLPPELLRKGRFDELWFVDLPNQTEREAVWAIQITKYGRDPKDYDLVQLARATEGLTGSEIEQVFVEALYLGFDQDTEPTDLSIASVLVDFAPLSKLMAEQISGLRDWSRGRARPATSLVEERKGRRIG